MTRYVAGPFTPNVGVIRLAPIISGVKLAVLALAPNLVHLGNQPCPVANRLTKPEALPLI